MSTSDFIEVGMRREIVADTGRKLSRDYPEEMRDYLAPHLQEYCTRLVAGVRMMDRTCIKVYGDIMRKVGEGNVINMLVALWPQLGVKDESEAQRLIGIARSAETSDPDALVMNAARFLRVKLMEKPELTAEVMREIGVAVPNTTAIPQNGKP